MNCRKFEKSWLERWWLWCAKYLLRLVDGVIPFLLYEKPVGGESEAMDCLSEPVVNRSTDSKSPLDVVSNWMDQCFVPLEQRFPMKALES